MVMHISQREKAEQTHPGCGGGPQNGAAFRGSCEGWIKNAGAAHGFTPMRLSARRSAAVIVATMAAARAAAANSAAQICTVWP